MKVTNVEKLRNEVLETIKNVFTISVMATSIQYKFKGFDQEFTAECKYCISSGIHNDKEFTILFMDDCFCFRINGENKFYTDYCEVKNKQSLYMRIGSMMTMLDLI